MAQSQIWEEGKSGNPDGRPAGKAAKPISSLRKTLTRLRKMEQRALDNIEAVISGKKVMSEEGEEGAVDKQMLETSKWVISTVSALTRSATQEEALKLQVRREDEPKAETQGNGTEGKVIPIRPKLSLDILPDGDDDSGDED